LHVGPLVEVLRELQHHLAALVAGDEEAELVIGRQLNRTERGCIRVDRCHILDEAVLHSEVLAHGFALADAKRAVVDEHLGNLAAKGQRRRLTHQQRAGHVHLQRGTELAQFKRITVNVHCRCVPLSHKLQHVPCVVPSFRLRGADTAPRPRPSQCLAPPINRPILPAVLDIREIRDNPEHVRERLATRGEDFAAKVGDVVRLDAERREAITAVEGLKARRNSASKEIGALMGQKKTEEAEAKKTEVRDIGDQISALDSQAAQADGELRDILLRLPNLPHADVPVGDSEDDNMEIRQWGEKPSFDFEPKPHTELCESLGLVDFARGAKLAGSGFLLYSGWGARLERALIQYLLDLHVHEHGYTEVSPPFIVGYDCMIGVGQFPKFEDQAYMVQEGLDEESRGKLYLVPTAEAPVANIHREELLKAGELPKNYCAYSPCFRAEAGAAGVGTRGMIRVHQFDKVELIKIVEPETSYDELDKLLGHAEKVLQSLNLHYRILQLCTADMSFGSATTYDIEVWAPGQGDYLEVSSCSNCEDYQSRRMNLRYKDADGKNRHPHILNGSGTALARLFVALIETYQQPDGSIAIPEPIQPYLRADRIPAS